MRLSLSLAALLLLAVRVSADDAASAAKQPPTDDTIINLCGDSLANMFAKCGDPQAITVNDDKRAILLYDAGFGFRVDDHKVTGSYFFDDWKSTFRGVKFGDTKDQVVKTLGKTYKEVKGKDFDAFGYDLNDLKATFWLYFTAEKVSSVQITLKN